MAKKANKTPAQARRNTLAEAIKARGHSPYNIWVVRPPFDDEDVLLSSDVAFDLFYYLEGDLRYVDIQHPCLTASSSATRMPIDDFVFAVATDASGLRTAITFKHALPTSEEALKLSVSDSSDTRIVTVEELNANMQRIENWRRIIPCIRRVKLHPMAAIERLVLQNLRDGKQKTIKQLLLNQPNEHPAKVVGAIATVLRKRFVEADVDTKPWSLNTLVCSEKS